MGGAGGVVTTPLSIRGIGGGAVSLGGGQQATTATGNPAVVSAMGPIWQQQQHQQLQLAIQGHHHHQHQQQVQVSGTQQLATINLSSVGNLVSVNSVPTFVEGGSSLSTSGMVAMTTQQQQQAFGVGVGVPILKSAGTAPAPPLTPPPMTTATIVDLTQLKKDLPASPQIQGQ